MNRHGHTLNKAKMQAYWEALSDEIEREITFPPKGIQALKTEIEKLENKLGEERSGQAFEIASRRA